MLVGDNMFIWQQVPAGPLWGVADECLISQELSSLGVSKPKAVLVADIRGTVKRTRVPASF